MKKKLSISIILFIILATVTLFYFLNKSGHHIVSENFSKKELIYLSEEDTTLGSLNIDLNVDIPTEYRDFKILQNIKTDIYMVLFGETYNLIDAESALDLYAEDLSKEYIENNSSFAEKVSKESFLGFNQSIILEGFSLLSDERIYSYGVKRFVDFGGAHPIQIRNYYNFDIKSGVLITENEIFKDDFYDELAQILQQNFMSRFDTKNANKDSPQSSDYSISDIRPNGNFYVNDQAICYIYNPYEIAAYYLGDTEISLPYDEIKHLMKEKNPLMHLYKK